MAINPDFAFALRVRLREPPCEARPMDVRLEGKADPDEGHTEAAPGAFGAHPRVALAGCNILIEAEIASRPRWWMSATRRRRQATCRNGKLSVGEGFVWRVCCPNDVLRLRLTLAGELRVSVHRDDTCLIAWDTHGGLATRTLVPTERYRFMTVGAPPTGSAIDQVPISRGNVQFVEVAVREDAEISDEDAKTCAEGLLQSTVQMDRW
jgi:hypothetical protein